MNLTHAQKRHFFDHGYVKVPNVVPQVMVDAAVKAINHSLGEGIDPAQVQTFRSRSYAPELQKDPVITNLLTHTPAFALAESAIGREKVRVPSAGQIALRFPSLVDPPPPPSPHLDGMYSPHNGVPKGEIRNFTMLLGVALSDVQRPFAGNLTLWPGTHNIYQEYFRERGPEALLEGMPKVEIPAPEQQLVRAGDVVLVHYQIGHGAAINVSPHTRYAIYFRLKHVDHDDHALETMSNIWMEWEGMQEFR